MFNNSNLYGSEWLALVFNNRNKNYGAFVLRSSSAHILTKSLFIAASVFVTFFIAPIIYAHFKPVPTIEPVTAMKPFDTERIVDIAPKKEEPKKEEPIKEKPAVIEPVKAKKFISNIVVVNKPIVEEPPTAVEISQAVISNANTEGVVGKTNELPVSNTASGGGGGAGEGPAVDNTVYNVSTIEKYPEFPGGMEAWAKFIQKNLRYPYLAQENGIQGKVYLSFVIEKDGSITDVKVVKGIGGGCDEEAVRVIKKSPKWSAGIQNDSKVRVRYNMPINYTLSL